jgi:hypothetical protein
MMTVGLKLLPRGILDTSTLVQIGRCLGAGILMAVVVVPLRHFPLVLPVAAGGLTYAVAALVLRAVSIAELRQVWYHLTSRNAKVDWAA